MRVHELIEKLRSYPDNDIVCIGNVGVIAREVVSITIQKTGWGETAWLNLNSVKDKQ